jgi:hypothetical protein
VGKISGLVYCDNRATAASPLLRIEKLVDVVTSNTDDVRLPRISSLGAAYPRYVVCVVKSSWLFVCFVHVYD